MIINNTYNLAAFGEYLRKLRKQGKLTQTDIQNITSINPKTTSLLEYGETRPTLDTLNKLSSLYKVDLVKALESFRYENSEVITKLYREIEYISLTDNLDELKEKTLEIRMLAYRTSPEENDFVDKKLRQLHYFGEIAGIINKTDIENVKTTESYILAALRVFHPKISITNIEKYYLDPLELRLLITLSFCFIRQNRDKESLKLITSVIKMIIELVKVNRDAYILLTQAYFIKSYILFILGKNEEVIDTCNEGIQISQENYSSKFLAQLYFRKGISEYLIDNPNYLNSLKSSISALELLGMYDLRDKYLNALIENYEIKLD